MVLLVGERLVDLLEKGQPSRNIEVHTVLG